MPLPPDPCCAVILDINPNTDAVPFVPIAALVMISLEGMIVTVAIPIAVMLITPIVGERLTGTCQHECYGNSHNGQEPLIILF